MAGVSFEEFSAPPGSELALEPLFGGNILESEGEPDGGAEPEGGAGPEVGVASAPLPPQPRPARRREGEGQEGEGQEGRRRRLKLQALGRRCREIRQVNARALQRLRQVQRVTRRLQLERRFLMQVLDAHGDRYRQGQLTVLLQDEGCLPAPPGNAENEPPPPPPPPEPPLPAPPPPEPQNPKKRRREPRGGRRGGQGGPQNHCGNGGQPKGEELPLRPSPTWAPPSPEKPPKFPKFSEFD